MLFVIVRFIGAGNRSIWTKSSIYLAIEMN